MKTIETTSFKVFTLADNTVLLIYVNYPAGTDTYLLTIHIDVEGSLVEASAEFKDEKAAREALVNFSQVDAEARYKDMDDIVTAARKIARHRKAS